MVDVLKQVVFLSQGGQGKPLISWAEFRYHLLDCHEKAREPFVWASCQMPGLGQSMRKSETHPTGGLPPT